VAARSKALTVFARLSVWLLGSNPSQGMNVCVRLFCVCVVLCVGRPCDRLIPRPRSPTNCVQHQEAEKAVQAQKGHRVIGEGKDVPVLN
jgi:hypothetical protein